MAGRGFQRAHLPHFTGQQHHILHLWQLQHFQAVQQGCRIGHQQMLLPRPALSTAAAAAAAAATTAAA